MRLTTLVLVCCAGLAGCAGGSSERVCDVFSPAEIDLPTTRDDARLDGQGTGDPTAPAPEQDC